MKKSGKYTVAAAFFVLLAAALFHTVKAQPVTVGMSDTGVNSLMEAGNKHYLNREYDLALQSYREVLNAGVIAQELYYNLGNACFKTDQLAQAILFYEKALRLDPQDEDTRSNLAIANARIIDKIDTLPVFFVTKWIIAIRNMLSPDQWAILSWILFSLTLAGIVLFAVSSRIFLKKLGFALAVFFLVASVAGMLLTHSSVKFLKRTREAIIMVSPVNAKSSPDEQSTNAFILHEGTKVTIVDSLQTWNEIRIADGNLGWVPKEALVEI